MKLYMKIVKIKKNEIKYLNLLHKLIFLFSIYIEKGVGVSDYHDHYYFNFCFKETRE